jgi:hypothetical protein
MDGADMTDIVDRLRRYAGDLCLSTYAELEAAQEIEQLRKENAQLKTEMMDATRIAYEAVQVAAALMQRGES